MVFGDVVDRDCLFDSDAILSDGDGIEASFADGELVVCDNGNGDFKSALVGTSIKSWGWCVCYCKFVIISNVRNM